MTHSGGLSGGRSVILATLLGFPTRTSVLHQLRADATGCTSWAHRVSRPWRAPAEVGAVHHLDAEPAGAHEVPLEQEQLHARLGGAEDALEGPPCEVRRQRRVLGRVDHLEVLRLHRDIGLLRDHEVSSPTSTVCRPAFFWLGDALKDFG